MSRNVAAAIRKFQVHWNLQYDWHHFWGQIRSAPKTLVAKRCDGLGVIAKWQPTC